MNESLERNQRHFRYLAYFVGFILTLAWGYKNLVKPYWAMRKTQVEQAGDRVVKLKK